MAAIAFLGVQPLVLRGDKARQPAPAPPQTAPHKPSHVAPLRKLVPQPRLLAQTKTSQQPAAATSPKPNVSIASPVGPTIPPTHS